MLSFTLKLKLTLLLLLGCSHVFSETRVVDYKEIPAKFEQYQDKAGFLWQTNKEGSLTSGETQYLPSGMKLFLNGKAFQPLTGKLTDDSPALDLLLTEKAKDLTTERNLWFDLERGGVRVVDTIKNTGSNATVKVELKTAFQFPWQNLVGTSGGILSGTSKVPLAARDKGITVKFSVADGRQDTVILVRSDETSGSPAISASSNSRELVFTYNLTIPKGQSRSLVHWILRRNIGQLDEIDRVASAFFERRQLLNSRVPAALAKTVHNFPASAFPKESGSPANLSRLVSLNEMLAAAEIQRNNQDILWMSPTNQLVGQINKSSVVAHGEALIPIDKIAAISGGAGIGRTPRVFMKDGRVFSGKIELKNFALKVGGEWAIDKWLAEDLNLLLLALDKTDGITPPKTESFVELRSGEVIAATTVTPNMPLVSVWGRRDVKLTEIEEFQYLSHPWPEYRLAHSDGSSLSVLPEKTPLNFTLASGETRTIDPRSIRRIWKNGNNPSSPDIYEARWIELPDVPIGMLPSEGFILQGNNLFSGGFAEPGSFTVIDGNTALDVAPAQIVSMRKLNPSLRSALPQFEIELVNGNLIKGGISQATLRIGTAEENWQVPTRHIIAYHSKGGAE